MNTFLQGRYFVHFFSLYRNKKVLANDLVTVSYLVRIGSITRGARPIVERQGQMGHDII